MTSAESVALWRILTVLAGWDEIIDVAEVEPDLDYLLDRMDRWPAPLGPFDDDDRDRIADVLRAEIEANLYYAHADYAAGFRHVEDVPDCDKAGIT